MANNFNSNVVEDLARVFLEKFESSKVLSKSIDTQLIQGRFTPRTGGTVSVKRPTDFNAIRTSGGDISGSTKSDVITGKATAVVQDYITIATEWSNIEEALESDQMEQLLAPMATRAVTTLETSLAAYMRTNAGLSVGTPGSPVKEWSHVAGAGALMTSIGCPMDSEVFYAMNPFVATELASAQSGLTAADSLVRTAWEKAQISDSFGGLRAIAANTLSSISDGGSFADRAGAFAGVPTQTYVSVKDTMIQTWSIDGLQANAVIVAGSVLEVTGRHYLNQSTRLPFVDGSGARVKFRATVVADVTIGADGAVDVVVTGPAVHEANGQYNTIDTAIADNDVVTVLGANGYTAQPNLFFQKQAFGLATVKLPKLYSTDTIATTEDGFSLRVSKYADGDANTQKVRFDLLPAFVTFNPFFAGLGYGTPA